MSPEQAAGEKSVDHRTDLWALGVIAFECLLGQRPFEEPTLGGLVLAICSRPMPIPSHVGPVPEGLTPVYVHKQSRALSEVLTQMLLGSNNYIANQVFLEVGSTLGGSVSLEKSLKVANGMLALHGLEESIHLEEGSGISRGTSFTARGLAELLHLFEPHADLLKGRNSKYKTGTLSGVRTLAGYAQTAKHGRVRFVIALKGNTGRLRYRLLREIERGL